MKGAKKVESRHPTHDGPMHPLERLIMVNPSGVARLLARTKELEGISREVAAILPVKFIPHCRVANLRGKVLVLQADSSAWATRLRYEGPAILDHLRRHGWPALTEAKILIGSHHSVSLPVRRAVMSNSTIVLLHSLARTYPDAELRAAWGRIASHHRILK